MGLGMSGASLFVCKTGTGLVRQFNYMRLLGVEVCPEVYHMLPDGMDGYAMEICQQEPLDWADTELIISMVELLETQVWNVDAEPVRGWFGQMQVWLESNAPWLVERLQMLYAWEQFPGEEESCLIHGDPTVANVLWRGKKILISDPLPPGGKIPALREVDEGKILQSCRGYESILDGLQLDTRFDIEPPSGLLNEKSWFWSCVHLARVVPYARDRGRTDVADWALAQSKEIVCPED